MGEFRQTSYAEQEILQAIVNNPEINLTENEIVLVDQYAAEIDFSNSNSILAYGTDIQKKLSDLSDSMLKSMDADDFDEISKVLAGTVDYLQTIEEDEEEKGFFFKKKKELSVQERYSKARENIDLISDRLRAHQMTLMKDCAMLDQLYNMNKEYFRELNIRIAAGKKKIEDARTIDIPARLEQQLEGGMTDVNSVAELQNMIDRLEKRIYDLELTRTIALQSAPQIRMIQSNAAVMADKIQSTLYNSIPLWKNQIVLALGTEHVKQSSEVDSRMSDVTNRMLLKNAQSLKLATVEAQKSANKGFVDVETLAKTNQLLIESLDEIVRVQEEGRMARNTAEIELARIDEEMKRVLM